MMNQQYAVYLRTRLEEGVWAEAAKLLVTAKTLESAACQVETWTQLGPRHQAEVTKGVMAVILGLSRRHQQ